MSQEVVVPKNKENTVVQQVQREYKKGRLSSYAA